MKTVCYNTTTKCDCGAANETATIEPLSQFLYMCVYVYTYTDYSTPHAVRATLDFNVYIQIHIRTYVNENTYT